MLPGAADSRRTRPPMTTKVRWSSRWRRTGDAAPLARSCSMKRKGGRARSAVRSRIFTPVLIIDYSRESGGGGHVGQERLDATGHAAGVEVVALVEVGRGACLPVVGHAPAGETHVPVKAEDQPCHLIDEAAAEEVVLDDHDVAVRGHQRP